jgi:hypothetical protein
VSPRTARHASLVMLATLVSLVVLAALGACRGGHSAGTIHVEKQDLLLVTRTPRIVKADLSNPSGPRRIGDDIVVAESGKGQISSVSVRDGSTRVLVSGFAKDSYAGYELSVQGLTVDPVSGLWIVCEAEGGGHVRIFDPKTFPTTAASGREIPLRSDPDDNPYAVAITLDRRIVVAGGTKRAYMSRFDILVQPALEPFIEVASGLAGLRVDDRSGDIFAAVVGSRPGDGSVVRWSPAVGPSSMATVAAGFTNLVDVAVGPNGALLAAEFGDFASESGGGKVWIVMADGSGRKALLLRGLDRPSGIDVAADGSVAISDFGRARNGGSGRLIDLAIAQPKQTR